MQKTNPPGSTGYEWLASWFLPQVFNGIVVGQIRWQRMDSEALGMLGQKWRGRLAGMLPRPIVDEK
jgi:hypothetical protein